MLAGLAVLVALHEINLTLLILFVLANGTARTLYYSASQAAIPELVPLGSLGRANGVITGTEAATEHLVGPIIGAAVFTLRRLLPFVADASAVGASGLALLGLRTHPADPASSGSIWDGARLLRSDERLRVLVTLIAALSGLQGLVAGILVLVATRNWGVPCALLAVRIVTRIGSAATLISAAVVSGVAYVVMALAHSWMLAGPAFVVVGFSVAAGSVVAISLRQQLTPNELMGRVGSAWRGIVWGAAPVGALLAGGLAVLGGLRLPILLAGAAPARTRRLSSSQDPDWPSRAGLALRSLTGRARLLTIRRNAAPRRRRPSSRLLRRTAATAPAEGRGPCRAGPRSARRESPSPAPGHRSPR